MLLRNLLVDYDTEEPMIFGHRFKYFGVSSKYKSHTFHYSVFILRSRLLDQSLLGLHGWGFWLCSIQSSTQYICWRSPFELMWNFICWLLTVSCRGEKSQEVSWLGLWLGWRGRENGWDSLSEQNADQWWFNYNLYDFRPVYDQVECDGWRLAGLWWQSKVISRPLDDICSWYLNFSAEGNIEKIRFSWVSNSKFVIFPQIYPCSNYKIFPNVPLLFPVSNGDSPVVTTFPRSNYRGFLTTGESYCTMYTLCSGDLHVNRRWAQHDDGEHVAYEPENHHHRHCQALSKNFNVIYLCTIWHSWRGQK